MPVAKRSGPRNLFTATSKQSDSTPPPVLNTNLLMEHPTFPALPRFSQTSYILMNICMCLTATLVQYLNIYKTVWWLPNSPSNYAIEFSLIDFNLLGHILMMQITPYLYLLILQIYPVLSSVDLLRTILALPLFISWGLCLTYFAYHINFSIFTGLYQMALVGLLLYFPLFTLLIYHRESLTTSLNRISTFLRLFPSRRSRKFSNPPQTSWFQNLFGFSGKLTSFLADWPSVTTSSTLFPIRYKSISGSPVLTSRPDLVRTTFYSVESGAKSFSLMRHHCLGTSADLVREEADIFRRDFNARLTDILIGMAHIVYYSCLLPVLFVPPQGIYFEIGHCIQHGLFTALAAFLLRCHFLLPADFVDLLHSCALHLGCWESIHTRTGHAQSSAWSASSIYPCGIVVKHMRGLFRSVEAHNAAEPGNVHHSRFYSLFANPLQISHILFPLATVCILFQLVSFNWTFEWYKLIGICTMNLFASLNFFFHLRTFILLQRVYNGQSKTGKLADVRQDSSVVS